jgi:phosphatidylinositol-4,5-bisphosphate 3-kinase catalytic subunit alpha/beta/delta
VEQWFNRKVVTLNRNKPPLVPPQRKSDNLSSWYVKEPYQITIHSIQNLSFESKHRVQLVLQIGLFHGGKSLCQFQKTSEKMIMIEDGVKCEWNENITFGIDVVNIPRMARLCMVVCEKKSGQKV